MARRYLSHLEDLEDIVRSGGTVRVKSSDYYTHELESIAQVGKGG